MLIPILLSLLNQLECVSQLLLGLLIFILKSLNLILKLTDLSLVHGVLVICFGDVLVHLVPVLYETHDVGPLLVGHFPEILYLSGKRVYTGLCDVLLVDCHGLVGSHAVLVISQFIVLFFKSFILFSE
jgi:hypothetical protein